MKLTTCTALLTLCVAGACLSPEARAQAGSAHGFDSSMGEGGYMGMGWHSRTDPGPEIRPLFEWRYRRTQQPVTPAYYWDPYGGQGYLTTQWTRTSAGVMRQLWYDPARQTFYYYP